MRGFDKQRSKQEVLQELKIYVSYLYDTPNLINDKGLKHSIYICFDMLNEKINDDKIYKHIENGNIDDVIEVVTT